MYVFTPKFFRFLEVPGQGTEWHLDIKHISEYMT